MKFEKQMLNLTILGKTVFMLGVIACVAGGIILLMMIGDSDTRYSALSLFIMSAIVICGGLAIWYSWCNFRVKLDACPKCLQLNVEILPERHQATAAHPLRCKDCGTIWLKPSSMSDIVLTFTGGTLFFVILIGGLINEVCEKKAHDMLGPFFLFLCGSSLVGRGFWMLTHNVRNQTILTSDANSPFSNSEATAQKTL